MRTRCAVILAGGLGLRLRSVVADIPKPMAPVSGRPFLQWLMDVWVEQGIERFILSVGYRADSIIDYFGEQYRGRPIDYAIERSQLGTGGAVLLAATLLEGEECFLVCNGDTFFNVSLADLEAFAISVAADWCLSLFRADQDNRFGAVSRDANDSIIALGPATARVGEPANGGVYWVRSSALAPFHQVAPATISLERDIIPQSIELSQHVVGLESRAEFLDIGVPNDYARAAALLRRIENAG